MLKVKIAKNETEVKDPHAEFALCSFVELKLNIDEMTKRMNEHKAVLIEKARTILGEDEVSTITFRVDTEAVKVSFSWDVKVSDEGVLQEILGERFQDLVTTTVNFKPDEKLRKMALDDDGLKACLSIKEKAPAVTVVK